MGFLSFRRERKAPAPLNIPDHSPALQHQSTLLDHFSQEVGSAISVSSWVIPDLINRRVEEHSRPSSTSKIAGSTHESFEDAPLGHRGGNMNDFDECDPNSPTALEMYQHWIDRGYHDEQCSLRQVPQDNLQSRRQVCPPIEPRFDRRITPRSPQQIPAPYPAILRRYPQVFRPSPSVGHSDEEEEANEFTHSGHRRLFSPDSSSDIAGDMEVNENWANFQDSDSCDSPVIGYNAPDYAIGDMMDDPEHDAGTKADFEASENMWDSNTATLQGLDLSDHEDFENYGPLSSPFSLVTESDLWNTSTETSYLIPRFFGFFHILDSPVAGGLVHDDALRELNDFPAEQSLFSPTSVYNDDANPKHELVLDEQYPFSPSSPAALHPFSPAFSWPPAPPDPYPRLQCPLEFSYSWICRATHTKIDDVPRFLHRPTLIFGVPKPFPAIIDWKSFRDPCHESVLCHGPRPLRLVFGTGVHDQFAFSFTHDDLPFPPEGVSM